MNELRLNWNRRADWTVVNNGHTIQANTPNGGYAEIAGKRFDLLQFHFHTPSEHAIDGERSDMEVHFEHKAADGKLAVLGVMMEVSHGRRHGDLFTQLMDIAPDSEDGEYIFGSADISCLVPPANEGSDFFRYEGSLTTPPCSEVVTWTVIRKPIRVSNEAVEEFKRLFEMNARPLQELNCRDLLERGSGRGKGRGKGHGRGNN